MSKTPKHVDLQPFIDSFSMLQCFRQNGYLQMEADKHEAYVTLAGLLAMTKGETAEEALHDDRLMASVKLIHHYAAWLSGKGRPYLAANFSVHVVKDDEPHDLVCTVLCTWHRRHTRYETITYPSKGEEKINGKFMGNS